MIILCKMTCPKPHYHNNTSSRQPQTK
ncbi:hypothetical protein Zm00014a_002191 [Zea mays]|uniref:Uncharacterized protein n=1 Tax=Zea mays TaxID=4577 RepID=A0A3L6DT78_MAIZE|nr:hypothetical protein Zm00014a_002191 [Zea mays]